MSFLTISNIVVFIGVLLTATGGLGTYYFGKKEAEKKDKISATAQIKSQNHINDLQKKLTLIQNNTTSIEKNIKLISESKEAKKHKWNEIKVSVPVFSDYFFLLFQSSMGKMSGNIRIKNSKRIYPFSTLVNNKLQLAIQNLWLPDKKQYLEDPILEYEITEASDEKDSLKIFLAGYNLGMGM
ncbi:hypothetical protein QUF90_08665 [Desulfococcaceae bacterium HSG9]|nr:hypothetical protein [Desulfococcaceae bacterium HSG9]